MLGRIAGCSKECTVALVGKYVKLHDAYLSVMESLYHAGFENDSQVEIRWVESEDLTDQAAYTLAAGTTSLTAETQSGTVSSGFGGMGGGPGGF